MSANYLQGKFFLKEKDLPSLIEIFEIFKTFDAKNIDQKFREIVEKKFSTKEEKINFIEEDFEFHLKEIKKEKEKKESSFFQALFLPFDCYRLECEKHGLISKSKIGYFNQNELKKMLQNLFPKNIHFKVKEFFQNQIKGKWGAKEAFLIQNEILEKFNLPTMNYYLKLERKSGEEFKRSFEMFFSGKIENFNEKKEEILKFYLPFFFKRKFFNFTNPFEFLFFYLKERFILWKTLAVQSF